MKSFAFETLDAGRLTVNREFVPLLEPHGLTTFDALMDFSGGQVAKNVLRERTTTRLDLTEASGNTRPFFLKRHRRPPLSEYVKSFSRLRRPLWGARNEWAAILRFHQAGIATMLPVALGESTGCSFLLTAGIEGCLKLTEWLTARSSTLHNGELKNFRQIIAGVADVARTMHAAGMHHQDFYLTHLMVSKNEAGSRPIHVLDLGRVRWQRRLSHRWIIKDLAQLDYSASRVAASDRMRFLARYLGRPLSENDRRLIGRILRKSRTIARHSAKNRL